MLIEAISRASGLPVATLYDIPNQPISGLREDDLIAHTFVKYFETGDASWPLLFPMTRAAIRSLGVIRAAAEVDQVKIRRFVVTGASKRGWTAWLTAAARDRRIVGIAPMVYDNLDIPGQMKHQLSSWGKYSPMIGDYTERGLQQQLDSERGRTLVRMVDPFAYRERIKVPTLIVNGANDPYWTVDALSLYWDRLSMPLRASIVPNAGHNLGDGRQAIEALSAFAVAQSERRQLPRPEARWGTTENSKTELRLTCRGPWIAEAAIWVADSRDRNFADKKWRVLQTVPTQGGRLDRRITVPIPADGFTAVLPEFRYKDRARSFRLSLPVRVLGG
jgi:PhoPQ-activated pathogenicity-related protein